MMKPLTVLSLFDGISCGKVALERAGVPIKAYYASEIDKEAIAISQHNHPEINRLGDVTKVRYENGVLYSENGEFKVGKIDLLIGGSPCQGLSNQGLKKGLDDGRSKLFYEYIRIKGEVNPDKFLLENVVCDNETIRIMSAYVKCGVRYIDSSDFSVQSRKRLYWFNWDYQPPANPNTQVFRDIADPNAKYNARATAKFLPDMPKYKPSLCPDKSIVFRDETGRIYTNDKFMSSKHYSADGKVPTVLACDPNPRGHIFDGVGFRRYTALDTERLFGVPDGYTAAPGIADAHRKFALGNGWEVNTLTYIFSQINNEMVCFA